MTTDPRTLKRSVVIIPVQKTALAPDGLPVDASAKKGLAASTPSRHVAYVKRAEENKLVRLVERALQEDGTAPRRDSGSRDRPPE